MNLHITALLSLLFFSTISTSVFAQRAASYNEAGELIADADTPKPPRDNFYDDYMHAEKLPLQYDYIHQKDVFWEKRIWRVIDVREKMNHYFNYAKAPLINIILDAAMEEKITLYSVMDDEFTYPLNTREVRELAATADTIWTVDPETFEEETLVVFSEINPDDIKQYRLKEVWFFDEEAGRMDVRILGIAPIIERFDEYGTYLNSGPLFWAYYPELRNVLAQTKAFNPYNDAAQTTWDDMFEARFFASHIIKQSNVHDRRIQDYMGSPEEALIEADKIHQEMMNFESDLWSY